MVFQMLIGDGLWSVYQTIPSFCTTNAANNYFTCRGFEGGAYI
jgi:hypothetical protein